MKILFLFLIIVFCSCGTLKTTHTQNVKSFALSAKALSAVPGKLYNNVADYRHELKMIEVATVYRPEKLVEQLNTVYALNQRFQANAVQIHSAASLIQTYAECLLALTDAAYEKQWSKQGDVLSSQLSSAFSSYNKTFSKKLPLNVGSFIGGVVTKVGSIKLRSLQKRYLKNFVDTGSLIINDVCDYFNSTVSPTMSNELSSLDRQFTDVMTHFYEYIYDYQEKQNANPFDYLKQYNPMYIELKEKLNTLHELQTKMDFAMQSIKRAHQSLRSLVDTSTRTELVAEIQDLYAAANDVKATLRKSEKK